jgi:serine/threonine protein kinase
MKAIEEINVAHVLSSGSFALVYACDIGVYKHFKTNNNEDTMEATRFIPLELSILRALQHVPFFVQLQDIIIDKELVSGITIARYKQDLNSYIKNTQYKEHRVIQKIMYHLVSALFYLHSINILHGDIKPGNILIDHNKNAVLCDFNSCHTLSPVNKKSLNYRYTYTLWYRPPEIFLKQKINLQADIWSLGIVFSEIFFGRIGILATPEELEDNYANHNNIFMRQLGYFGTPHEYSSVYKNYKPRYEYFFKKIGITEDNMLCNFLRSMLQIMPYQRNSSKQLLDHEYFSTIPKIIPFKTPNMVIDEANILKNTPYKSYCKEMNNLKNNLQQTLTHSFKYCSITTLQYEVFNFAHYIFVLTNNNQHSVRFQLGVCAILATKILDPTNYFIDEASYEDSKIYEQELLMSLDYKIHFQNTLYYKMYLNGPLTEFQNNLLYATLFSSYPEDFTTTEEVKCKILDYANGKNIEEKYYKDLQKILAKNESILKDTTDESNK